MNASSCINELGFSWIDASQHHSWITLLPKADQVPVILIYVPVLNRTKINSCNAFFMLGGATSGEMGQF